MGHARRKRDLKSADGHAAQMANGTDAVKIAVTLEEDMLSILPTTPGFSGLRELFWADFRPLFPPGVAHGPLLTAHTAAIE